jgi:hypothetical protein
MGSSTAAHGGGWFTCATPLRAPLFPFGSDVTKLGPEYRIVCKLENGMLCPTCNLHYH